MGYIRLEKDSDGIVELIFDQPGKAVNTMGQEYDEAMRAAVAELQAMVAGGGLTGVYVRSGKPAERELATLRAAGCNPDFLADDLAAAVPWILERSRRSAAPPCNLRSLARRSAARCRRRRLVDAPWRWRRRPWRPPRAPRRLRS